MAQGIDEKTYLNGASLNEALKYAAPELIERQQYLSATDNIAAPALPKNADFIDGLSAVLNVLSSGSAKMLKYQNVINAMKADITRQIKIGDLIAYGYSFPRHLTDTPIKIPADIFIAAEINWDKSELKFRDMEFTGIRILTDINPIIEIKPEIKNTPKLITVNNDPEKYVDEKAAAEYLGLSFRTLQGYRTTGGGPEYMKLRKAVRYKIADLIAWTQGNKKANTSQY